MDVFVPAENGQFISEKQARISELIKEYDPHLELAWIPPDRRNDPRDKPFAVIETTREGKREVVCYADDCDERLLARIYEMDAGKHGNLLTKIDAHNDAIRAVMAKEHQEELEEERAIAHSILKSPKSVYKHNGRKYR